MDIIDLGDALWVSVHSDGKTYYCPKQLLSSLLQHVPDLGKAPIKRVESNALVYYNKKERKKHSGEIIKVDGLSIWIKFGDMIDLLDEVIIEEPQRFSNGVAYHVFTPSDLPIFFIITPSQKAELVRVLVQSLNPEDRDL